MLKKLFSLRRFSRSTLWRGPAMALLAVLLTASVTLAQGLSTVYVDVTNGSDTYTGANPTNSPAGTGPKASIGAGLSALANNGTLVIMAGSYNGVDGSGGNVNINSTTYSNLTSGLTIKLQTLNANNQVNLSAGQFIFNIPGGTLTFVQASGNEYLTISSGFLTLTAGSVNIPTSSAVQLANNGTITISGASAFTNQAPQVGANVSLVYNGGSNITAGPEANYGNYGTGTITVSKTAGTTVTFPNAISTIGGITVSSGNATFSGAVTMNTADITNSGTGTVTFSSPVSFSITDGTASANLGSVLNTNTGSIVFNGAATWSAATLTAARDFSSSGVYLADNQSTGSIVFDSTVSLVNSQSNSSYNVTVVASNDAAGTLTLGSVIANKSGSGNTYVTLNVQNTAANGILNLAGGSIGNLTNNNSAGTVNVNGPLTLSGTLTNAGTVALSGNTVTLNGTSVTHTVSGTVTSTSAGGFNVTGATVSFTGGGTIPNVTVSSGSNVTFTGNMTAGNMTVTGSVSVNDAVTLTVASLTETGNITLGGGTSGVLAVKGDFNRTSGTFTANAGSNFLFNGSAAQAVNSGPNFQIANLEFNNTGGTITLGASIRASGTVKIDAGTNVALGTLNIILNANNASMVNNGTYSASGGGGVILGGSTTVAGGNAASGITISGSGTYSYITVDVGSSNTATVNSSLLFNGVLTLATGTLSVSAGNDLSPTGASASVVRNIVTSSGITLGASATFDAQNTDYDLTYNGNLSSGTSVAAGTSEFTVGHVRNLTISTTGNTLTLTSTSPVTIKGSLTLSNNASFNFDATTPYNVTINGALNVATGATLGGGSASNTITLAGNNQNSVVAGTISAASVLTITGSGSSINGSGNTSDQNTIANLDFEPTANGASFTSNNLESITGNVTIQGTSTATGATATIAMNSVNASLTGNLVVGNATVGPTASVTIAGTSTSVHSGALTLNNGTLTYTRGGASTLLTGPVTLTAGTLILGSNLEVNGTTTQAAGNLVLATYSYTQDGQGTASDYNRTGSGTVTGGGTLVLNATASHSVGLTPGSSFTVPNLTFTSGGQAINIASSMTVSNSLTHTSGNVTITTGTLTLSGNTYTVASTAGSMSGNVALTGSSVVVTAATNYTIATSLTVNSLGSVTLQSNAETGSGATPRTFTVTTLTQTQGNINIGIDNLVVTGGASAFTRTTGNWTMSSGSLEFNGSGLTFNPGTGWAVDNLQVLQAAINSTQTAFTVNKYLTLGAPLTTATPAAAGTLILGSGATIERQANTDVLDMPPTFGSSVNLSYTTSGSAINTGVEVPASDIINNVTVNMASGGSVVLTGNIKINGTLTLANMLNATTNSKTVTMASGATLVLNATGTSVLDQNLVTLGPINIVYNGATTTSTRELGAISSGAHTAQTSNITVKQNVQLDAGLTIGGALTFDGGSLYINGNTLTLLGNVSQTSNAGFFANTGASAAVTFGGSANTNLVLKGPAQTVPASVNLTIGKATAGNTVTLSGGNLDFATNGSTLMLNKGILVTGSNTVILSQSNNGVGQPTQGFIKTDTSYVFGNVQKFLNITATNASVNLSQVVYPVGASPAVSGPFYRPLTLYFNTLPPSSINLTVSFVDQRPSGSNGFPISDGSQQLTGYPNFYWYLKPDIGLTQSYVYNLDAQAQGYTGYTPSQIQNIRYIVRDSGSVSNPWQMLGTDAGYVNATLPDGSPDVRVTGVQGHISSNGTIFTYSQTDRPPTFTAALGNVTKNEGDTLKFSFAATDPDLGQTVSFKLVGSAPSGATISSSGSFSWIIGYNTGGNSYPITVQAVGSGGVSDTTDTTFTVTVISTGRPSFRVAGAIALHDTTIKYLHPFTFTYKAIDPDTAHVVTYAMVSAIDSASITPAGVFTWNPTFAQIGKTYTVIVVATDTTTHLTDTTMAAVTVSHSTVKGDVSGNGTVSAYDATLVLMYSVGDTTLNAEQLWAGDVSGNGQVTAYDAALILRYVAGDTTVHFAPKASKGQQFTVSSEVSAGTVSLGTPVSDGAEMVSLPVMLNNAHSVNSIEMSLAIGQAVSVQGVAGNMPRDWQLAYHVSNGVLKLAMAGVSPLSAGNVATIQFKLSDKAARANVVGSAMINENDMENLSSVEVKSVPNSFALDQNYPNPFNPTTTIKYQLAKQANVTLRIYSVTGQLVRTIVDGVQQPGYYSVTWNGLNNAGEQVASGVYFYRIEAGSFVSMKKMLLLK